METMRKKDKNKVLYEYECGYCGHNFRQKIGKVQPTESKRSNVSSQVRCPFCKNFLKTWKDGKEVLK